MSYSRLNMPAHINFVKIKGASLKDIYWGGTLGCAQIFKDTWVVFTGYGVVEAMYYGAPNQHGWSPPESHAKSHVNRSHDINPFELDMIA